MDAAAPRQNANLRILRSIELLLEPRNAVDEVHALPGDREVDRRRVVRRMDFGRDPWVAGVHRRCDPRPQVAPRI
jgi:hypothetical protein